MSPFFIISSVIVLLCAGYCYRQFVVFPLFGGPVGDGGCVCCGNPLFGVSGMNCGDSFGDIAGDCSCS